jgi:hypothetical protein
MSMIKIIMRYHKHPGVSMTVDNINVEETVKRVTELIAAEKDLSSALRASLEVLLLLINLTGAIIAEPC